MKLLCVCVFCSLEPPSENLCIPNITHHESNGMKPFDRYSDGVANESASKSQPDLSDCEVQDILGNTAGTTTVQVLVEMNGDEDCSTNADFLHSNMNGESDFGGYSSEEDSRYPPQMALTPTPASPIPPEDINHNNRARPPILPRFSFEEQVTPIVRKFSGSTPSTLAPIKSKTMPERLRLDNIRPTPVKPTDIKPPSPSTETQLAPLRFAKAKQSPVPLNIKPQAAGSSSPREVGTPENENGWQWARKVKAKTDPLVFSPGSDSVDKAKEKRPVANNAAGQILPVISDKLSHVTQVQGTRQDQIEARRKSRRRTSKNRSIPEDLDLSPSRDADESVEEDSRTVRTIGISKDKKPKKKKVRKVLSWNF